MEEMTVDDELRAAVGELIDETPRAELIEFVCQAMVASAIVIEMARLDVQMPDGMRDPVLTVARALTRRN